MGLDEKFQEYFEGLERSGNEDRCFLCRRTPADVKLFFGFDEDGVPIAADEYGLEDVVLENLDIMSYRGARPVCAVCQLNYDTIFMLAQRPVLDQLLEQMENERDHLWPRDQA